MYLSALKSCKTLCDVAFVRYEQSSQVLTAADSSVSYASAVIRLREGPAGAAAAGAAGAAGR